MDLTPPPRGYGGHWPTDWPGRWVLATVTAAGTEPAVRTIRGLVTRATPAELDGRPILYLTVCDPEGFIYPGIRASTVTPTESALKGVF